MRRLCGDGDGIALVAGLAGSGKTTALTAAVQAWTAGGSAVVGLAVAARTAQALGDAAGIPAMSITRFLHQIASGQLAVGRDDVVVVDEAGMVGTRTLNQLATVCEHAKAKLVLVGDPYQLPELTAGGTFAHLTHQPDTIGLTTNRRQRQPWEIAALTELRAGDPTAALAAYKDHNRVHVTDDHDQARQALVDAWHADRAAGLETVMIAVANRDVDALNRLARQRLQVDGTVGADVLQAAGRVFAIGDRVMTLRNDRWLGVLNGTVGTITAIDATAAVVTVHADTNGSRALPFFYVGEGGLTHAYAITLHKAQGVTVDTAHVLASDGLPCEHAYTALSRGRNANHLYTATADQRDDVAHALELADDVETRLKRAINRTIAHEPALAYLEQCNALSPGGEEAEILGRSGHPPPDRTSELRHLQHRLRSSQESLDHARWREQCALGDLHSLGLVGRRLHSSRTRDARQRLDSARRDITRHEPKVGELNQEVHELQAHPPGSMAAGPPCRPVSLGRASRRSTHAIPRRTPAPRAR